MKTPISIYFKPCLCLTPVSPTQAISEDLSGPLKELVAANLVVDSDQNDASLTELSAVLDLLLAPELKTLVNG